MEMTEHELNKKKMFELQIMAMEEGHWNITKKKDLIETLLNNRDKENKTNPVTSYFSLIDMARRKRIKNFMIMTKYEFKKALGLNTTHDNPHSKPLILLTTEYVHLKFVTQKEAMDYLSVSVSRSCEAIKNGKIKVNDVEYKLNSNFENFKNYEFNLYSTSLNFVIVEDYYFLYKMDKKSSRIEGHCERLRLRRYSRLRSAELIDSIINNQFNFQQIFLMKKFQTLMPQFSD